jgi:hypothetical protein
MIVVFGLAEIARTKQFLRRDDLRALLGRFIDPGQALVQVLARVRAATHLHERDVDFLVVRFHGRDYTGADRIGTVATLMSERN